MSVPSSTYRLQLRPGFTFADARNQVGYLRKLGVGALYASPVLDATPGSAHGYDVVDPARARPELGGEPGRQALARELREAGLGFVVDIVPNHMAVPNPWWLDVLRHGQSSAYASYFDIDWSRGRILLPVLGDDVELKIEGSELVYYQHRFPIAPGTEGGTPDEVHARQHYELVHWRRGNTELNYRRFFDITSLAAVRVELPEVFQATHGEVLRWVAAGEVTGLRVDHPDGLADPGGYLRAVRSAAPDAWLVVEKILHPGEDLPQSWPVDGTTGYDALREITGVFLDPAAAPRFSLLAGSPDYHAVEEDARRLVTDTILVAEMRRIGALVPDGAEAVAELMIAFPVYRSYLPEGSAHWALAVERVKVKRPDLASTVDLVDRLVRGEPHGEVATRIQQTSGMVVAKGTEDTAFYRYTRFAALNEVGGSPDHFGLGVAEFHDLAAAREAGHPATMTTLTTHDTKRSEDVRARLAVLSELPDEFADAVERWTEKCGIDEPALNLLAWQTLVGAWPISAERLREYLLKAAREAKIRTTWTEPDEEFEAEIAAWPARALDEPDVAAFAERIKAAGWSNALGQKLIQLTAPGVPDVYQGTELWDLSLVDPDNRRPVDYGVRRELLEKILGGELPEIDDTGTAKLLVVHKALTLRRERPELFRGYRPLHAEGPAAAHAVAFARAGLVTVATRLPVRLASTGGWRDTVLPLPPGTWTDALTGSAVRGSLTAHKGMRGSLTAVPRVGELLTRYPVALLVRDGA
ncbi:malto-oligosyltrehalose synthase [Amycolatopsis alkalitolerans]|uniref:Malto-oligosyltrehalose synthase n=1 Tax=Amycolatopsis alkalitolerans TaxID=2547244 RepID=A0A5C4MAT4_9PSEU|nr:malto-oligosyltrehalose synthase [Amycolatopsis alkalitolerans]TNC29719.1 malto-oligosyltrehalose synthase [Amycolatopsis alkalitolerans]